jgi:hypothetical protein
MSFLMRAGAVAASRRRGIVVPPEPEPEFELWTPAEITTALWLDADDADTFTLTGADIDEWRDKSGNTRHFTPPGTQPTRTATGINSRASVAFGSGQDVLASASFTAPVAADGLLIAYVFRRAAQPVNFSIPMCYGAVNAQWSVVMPSNAGTVPSGQRNSLVFRNNTTSGNEAASAAGTLADSTDYIHSGVMSNAQITQWLSGVLLSGAAGAATRNLGSAAALTLGGQPSTGNQFQGLLAELVVVYADTTTDTRQLLEGYLAHKWGLAGDLPGDHPYKDNPPLVTIGYRDVVLADTPKAYYRLGEGSGSTVADEIAGQHGTVNGTVTFGVPGAIAGDTNTAISGDSSNSNFLEFPLTLSFTSNDGLAAELWFDWDDDGGTTPLRDATSSAGTIFIGTSGGNVQLRFGGLNIPTTVSAAAYRDTGYHHWVVEYVHSTTTVNLYLDGDLVYTSTISARSGSTTTFFRLFRNGTATGGSSGGTADEVAFYDHPLGAARVLAHYNKGIGA